MDRNQVLAISGGASGIGFATAQLAASKGHQVILIDLRREQLDEALRELPGSEHFALEADVTSAESVDAAFASIQEDIGRLDGIVAAAGIVDPTPSAEVSDASLMRLIDIHLMGAIRMSRAAYPLLKQSDKASIVFMSSMGARLGVAERLGYNADKAGIEGVARTLAVEWVTDGIRANAVAPAWVKTPAIAGLIESGYLDPTPVEKRTPMGRFAEPEEIAEVISFLLDPASRYITGQSIAVDGGMTIHFPQPQH